MTKKDPGKSRGPGRPPKGKLKVTLRLSPAIVDALSQARERTGRDKSDIAEDALSAYLNPSERGKPPKTKT
jgi:hypothetical protein